MNKKIVIYALISFIFPIALSGCAPEEHPQRMRDRALHVADKGTPALWLADFDGHKMYLFGTHHLGAEKADWLDPVIAQALSVSDSAIFEADTDAIDPLTAMGKFQSAHAEHGKLSSQLSPQLWRNTQQLADALGIPTDTLELLPPFIGALTFHGVFWEQLGLRSELGADNFLRNQARLQDKRIVYLETADEQLDTLINMSHDAQLEEFSSIIDDPTAAKNKNADLWEQWYAGDVDKAKEAEAQLRKTNAFDMLLGNRNKRWLPILKQHAHDSAGSSFVAVGLLHLLGSEGLPALLRESGVDCQRIAY